MKPIVAIIGRITIIASTALGLSTGINYSNHKGYWEGTIYRVQTVDFNLLSHSLPTKLSYALIEDNEEEVQRTLDSNYGLFGLVVTDCETEAVDCQGQKILYSSNSPHSWKQRLDEGGTDYLTETNAPFDILRDPPPLFSVGGFDNSRDDSWNTRETSDDGEIIGRVYYLRGVPPTFKASYTRWLLGIPKGSLLSNSGSNKYFSLTLISCLVVGIGTSSIIELFAAQKRAKQNALLKAEKDLVIVYDDRNKLLGKHNAVLADLHHELMQEKHRNRYLQSELYKKVQELKIVEQEGQQQIEKLASLRNELLQTRGVEALTRREIEEREHKISDLESQISRLEVEKQENEVSQAQISDYIRANQLIKDAAFNHVSELERKIGSVEDEKRQIIERTHLLEEEIRRLRGNLDEEISRQQARHQEEIQTYEEEIDKLTNDLNAARELERIAIDELSKLARDRNENVILDFPANLSLVEASLDETDLSEEQTSLEEDSQSSTRFIDFSNVKMGIVGGHSDFQRKVIEKLYETGLQEEPVTITSTKGGGSPSRKQIRSRLRSCNLILVFTYYTGHPLTKNIDALVRRGSLTATVRKYPRECKPEIIEDVLSFLEQNPNFAA
jgi:hypothetical protein